MSRPRVLVACLLACLVACAGAPPSDGEPPDDTHDVASSRGGGDTHDVASPRGGQVCRYGTRDQVPEEPPPPCPEGLRCCYPCGMEGCDWVCATPEQCASWTTIP